MKYLKISVFMGLLLSMVACGDGSDDFSPKPRGYFRIELPGTEYRRLDINCPFTFDYNSEANWEKHRVPCWGDVYYPDIKARLQLTYKEVTSENLEQLLNESRNLAFEHTVKASGIQEKVYNDPIRDVHGILYKIDGEAATNTQFYMTDSTNHFLRGVLYFYAEPNVDSLLPVNEYMFDEIVHIIETLQWQNSSP